MQGIYNYIPETNDISRVHGVAALLHLQSVLHVMCISPVKCDLYLYISTFRSLCAAHNMADFCSFLISCFPGMLLRYCLSEYYYYYYYYYYYFAY
jgi:hypothetical protein